ncbi:MAG: M23 family peptidase [Deltaproteobacteria bacterium]|nr:MAG: M23 family peptidase [Deltaproteobacteria bacterium]
MNPINPDSKLELLHRQQPARKRRGKLGTWTLAAVLMGVTAWNTHVIFERYGTARAMEAPRPTARVTPEPENDAAPPTAFSLPPSRPHQPVPAPLHRQGEETGTATASVVDHAANHDPSVRAPGDRYAAVAYRVVAARLQKNQTVAEALSKAGLAPEQTQEIVAAMRGVFDFRRARPGDAFRVKLSPEGEVLFFDYERSPTQGWYARRDAGRLWGFRRAINEERQVAHVTGTLRTSLYEAMEAIGESPALAVMLAEVLAWDIDFYRDPQRGDRFQIIVEKYFHKGRFLRYGEILAAEYDGAPGTYRVFRYESEDGRVAYYDADGRSAQKALLKAPMKLVRITSGYGKRRHPILGYTKMHRGVDYGAPIGTPVMAVGDGTVIQAGYAGPNGNLVGIRHANGYSTWYAHLSKILVRRGQRVHQKDYIGKVGSTGRSTGPHLHYAVKKDGVHVNPLTLKLPPRRPLSRAEMPRFRKTIATWQRWMDSGDLRLAAARATE